MCSLRTAGKCNRWSNRRTCATILQPPRMGDDANALKGIEALYSLTKAAFDAEFSRYDAAEAKAGRYLTMLGLIIGASVLKLDDAVWVWRHAPASVGIAFVVASGLTV